MFAWPGRASDAATIDAAVVGGTSAQQQRQREREQRTPNSGGKKNREQRRSVLCVAFVLRPHLLSPTGVLSPPSDEAANYSIQTATSWRSHINDEPNLEPCTTVRNHIIQYVFYDSCKAVTPFYVHFARSLVCTRTKCRVFL